MSKSKLRRLEVQYKARIEELEDENSKLIDLLKRYEWKGPNDTCPDCGWTERTGHPTLCDLGKAIK